jgi:hypothetical protein
MSSLRLRALRAKHGDSLLLLAEGAKVLIDGGPSGVYNQTLRDHLLTLERDGEDQPRIDLLMVSHIDADHIDGVLDLTAELIESREDEREPIVRIDRAWHNSFSDMIALGGSDTSAGVRARAARVASAFEELSGAAFNPVESSLVLASVAQGRQLRLDLKALNIDINRRFRDRVALQDGAPGPWECGELSLTVIGPTHVELDDLREEWKKQLDKILSREEALATASAEKLDRSVANLSSIVAIAEAGGKTALLTGDARGDMIRKWLADTGRLDGAGRAHFDILKLPHHGSDRNVSLEFFQRITADHYVVCGNGGHGNPEPATLAMLFEARPDLGFQLHMTYGPDELKQNRKFKKAGNVARLDEVLSPPGRKDVLRFPGDGETFVEIAV